MGTVFEGGRIVMPAFGSLRLRRNASDPGKSWMLEDGHDGYALGAGAKKAP
jgi:hypothetical protein